MRITVTDSTRNLADILGIEQRCGGSGKCGSCRVRLLSGEWLVNGKSAALPCDAPGCQTRLKRGSGIVGIPDFQAHPVTETAWEHRPLPECSETVAAFDIGTTTLAAAKIENGCVTATAGCYNPQNRYGDNVAARIQLAARPAGMEKLRNALLDAMRSLLAELGNPVRIAVAGNTVMCSIFHNVSPEAIGVYPYRAPQLRFPERRDLFGGIPVLTVPCISGYIGGDITAGLLETGLPSGGMLVDIGTNCEIVFRNDCGFFAVSAAAGPAFEGAGIAAGMRAESGAIDHIRNDGTFTVIGGGSPRGLCGSAMIDFLATERRNGGVDEFGRFVPPASERQIAPGIRLSEADIEQLLKAKSAVCAGILTLEKQCGQKAEKIYLAGGFARYLNPVNAVDCGLLPPRNYTVCGNTGLGGAARLAAAPETMAELEKLAILPQELHLGNLPGFDTFFCDNLLLP